MICPDCKGKKFYEGLEAREACRRCQGTGEVMLQVPTPAESERFIWANTYREPAPNMDQFVAAATPHIKTIVRILELRLEELDAKIANLDSKPDWFDENSLECVVTNAKIERTRIHSKVRFDYHSYWRRFTPVGLWLHGIPEDVYMTFSVDARCYPLFQCRNVRPYTGKWPGRFTAKYDLEALMPGYDFEFHGNVPHDLNVAIEIWGTPSD